MTSLTMCERPNWEPDGRKAHVRFCEGGPLPLNGAAGRYLHLAHREGWDKRETDRQLRGALFERAVLARPKVSPAVTQLRPDAETIFKDSYLVDFLGLPEAHSEQELQTAIIVNLKRFLLELGRDFAFVGEQYLLPVGGQDFHPNRGKRGGSPPQASVGRPAQRFCVQPRSILMQFRQPQVRALTRERDRSHRRIEGARRPHSALPPAPHLQLRTSGMSCPNRRM
jgi:predicted nuclease of restriction endonuclease-like (RecB) superfamily